MIVAMNCVGIASEPEVEMAVRSGDGFLTGTLVMICSTNINTSLLKFAEASLLF